MDFGLEVFCAIEKHLNARFPRSKLRPLWCDDGLDGVNIGVSEFDNTRESPSEGRIKYRVDEVRSSVQTSIWIVFIGAIESHEKPGK